jgi:hypothetical protein
LFNYTKLMFDVEIAQPTPPADDKPSVDQPDDTTDDTTDDKTDDKTDDDQKPTDDEVSPDSSMPSDEQGSALPWILGGVAAVAAAAGAVFALLRGKKPKK